MRRSLGRQFEWRWGAFAVSSFGTGLAFGAFPLIAIVVLHAGPGEVSALAAAALAVGAAVAVPLGPWVEFRRKRQYGLAFAIPCTAGLIGSRLSRRLVARYGGPRVLLATPLLLPRHRTLAGQDGPVIRGPARRRIPGGNAGPAGPGGSRAGARLTPAGALRTPVPRVRSIVPESSWSRNGRTRFDRRYRPAG